MLYQLPPFYGLYPELEGPQGGYEFILIQGETSSSICL